ncbi:ead/Ea22-like family protein [Enterobacter cloacae complex sp. IR5422]|uniref:ead/Ea22-like family protein n=1 Tax=Enterobacter cloacae complex sp. IR5422 TaxID=3412363 RepID=UPI003BA07602
MSNIDKRALREAANAANSASWGNWEPYKPHKGARGYEVKVGVKAVAQHCLKVDSVFIAAANPATVLALLDELEAAKQDAAKWFKAFEKAVSVGARYEERIEELTGKLEAAEKRIAELPGQKRLIGWRMADYADETADPALAKNWATAVDVLPIFEGDVNTKLSPAAAGKGE